MRINHNITAMNTDRQLQIATGKAAKSMEKLSSGLRINRAADDAAGLSISEKMRNQIRGLDRASANSQDGISLIQTAEGALDETQAILKRMRELTVQAGNEGTLQQDDLEAIRDEFKELADELTGISERTEFNGKKLLDGSYEGVLQIGANQKQQLDLDVDVKTITGEGNVTLGKDTVVVSGRKDAAVTEVDADKGLFAAGTKITATGGISEINIVEAADPTGAATPEGAKGPTITFEAGVLTITGGIKYVPATVDGDGNPADSARLEKSTTITAKEINDLIAGTNLNGEGIKIEGLGDTALTIGTVSKVDNLDVATGKEVTSLLGSTSSADLGVALSKTELTIDPDDGKNNLDEVLKAGVFFEFEGMSQVDVKTATDANLERMDAANKAISKVRSHLGANQNRLEHTINNLDNAAENIQAAESRIRDVDMAKEMIVNSKENILQQAATAMLAQANQAPQIVLRLLG